MQVFLILLDKIFKISFMKIIYYYAFRSCDDSNILFGILDYLVYCSGISKILSGQIWMQVFLILLDKIFKISFMKIIYYYAFRSCDDLNILFGILHYLVYCSGISNILSGQIWMQVFLILDKIFKISFMKIIYYYAFRSCDDPNILFGILHYLVYCSGISNILSGQIWMQVFLILLDKIFKISFMKIIYYYAFRSCDDSNILFGILHYLVYCSGISNILSGQIWMQVFLILLDKIFKISFMKIIYYYAFRSCDDSNILLAILRFLVYCSGISNKLSGQIWMQVFLIQLDKIFKISFMKIIYYYAFRSCDDSNSLLAILQYLCLLLRNIKYSKRTDLDPGFSDINRQDLQN